MYGTRANTAVASPDRIISTQSEVEGGVTISKSDSLLSLLDKEGSDAKQEQQRNSLRMLSEKNFKVTKRLQQRRIASSSTSI